MNKQKGFTIIELIVVIAIIAVLASIVLVNVTKYINKGKDAAIKGNLSGMMTNAASYFDTNSNYTAFCASAQAVSALSAIDSTRGDTGKSDCNNSATEWAACGALKDDSANAYCVDSTGTKKTMAIATCVTSWAATACP